MGLRSWINQVMGSTKDLPDASELNELNCGVTPPPLPQGGAIVTGVIAPVGANGVTTYRNANLTGAVGGNITIPSITSNSFTFPSMNMNSSFGQFGAAVQQPALYTVGNSSSPTIVTFFDNSGQWVVKLDKDGSVTWSNGQNISEAARAFASMLNLGVEQKAGITQSMKLRARDQVFEEVIRMAQERGPLSADDLTFMLESSKIIEKLRGTNE